MRSVYVIAAALMLGTFAQPAFSATYGFYNITGNSVANAAAGEGQLRMDVVGIGNDVRFEFYHDGNIAMAIAQIYFDLPAGNNNPFALPPTIDNSFAGVNFALNPAPPNLPGGGDLNPTFVADSGAGATAPPPHNGVSPSEYVALIFGLQAGFSLSDVFAAITDGTVRVGLHVIAFANGGSESFVNNPTPIPLPPALLLFLSALVGLGYLGRRRNSTGPGLKAA